MTRCLFIMLFAMVVNESSAQTFDKYVDRLYFGILSRKPDSSIQSFIAKYVPIITKKFDSKGTWTAYPPGDTTEPPFETVTNTFIFYHHPYFDEHFESGQLAITQKIYSIPKWIDNITDIKLSFEFYTEEEAKKAYKKLADIFSSFNVLKRLTSDEIEKAEFTDKNSKKFDNHIQIILAKDFFTRTKYQTLTKKGVKISSLPCYKILVELDNDLY